MSEAIRIFLTQSVNSDGLPFRPHLRKPNKVTLDSFSEVETGDFMELSREAFGKYLKGFGNEKD